MKGIREPATRENGRYNTTPTGDDHLRIHCRRPADPATRHGVATVSAMNPSRHRHGGRLVPPAHGGDAPAWATRDLGGRAGARDAAGDAAADAGFDRAADLPALAALPGR